MQYYPRAITQDLLEALASSPAVFLNGPRQAGKSTLTQLLTANNYQADYVTFDDASTFAAASYDPEAWLNSFIRPVIIDEVQRVPELFRALKKRIDEIRLKDKEHSMGRFLLTGSANILALPNLADALVGRMQILTLYPLASCEIQGFRSMFIDSAFSSQFYAHKFPAYEIESWLHRSTFPELATHPSIKPARWFDAYLTTLLQRDVRALAEIEKLAALPHILQLLATRAGGLLNDADVARDASLNTMTYRRYRTLLSQLFLLLTVPPWYRNIGKRLVKSPKVYLTDTALLCHLLNINQQDLQAHHSALFGSVVENFVATELCKQLTWQEGSLYHYRSYDNQEIDFVIERRNGQLLAIEVKARTRVDSRDFAAIVAFKSATGKDFIKGIVFYLGTELISFGKDLYAVPISALWQPLEQFEAKGL